MTEELKIYWDLYEEWYSNEEILNNFTNLLDLYLPSQQCKILDIGCGQSPYIIHFAKNSNHELYAVDTEPLQIELLKKRISHIEKPFNVNLSSEEFPVKQFEEVIFDGIIISNLLHFFTLENCKKFIKPIIAQITKNSIILITVHSTRHASKNNTSYFKHFFKKFDFYSLFPKTKFDYLYFDSVSAQSPTKQKEFLKEWIKRVCKSKGIKKEEAIKIHQDNYLLNSSKTENMTLIIKMK